MIYSHNEDGSGYSVVGCNITDETEIEIPSEYAGEPVTSIKQNAFKNKTSLTNIIVPDSVTSISRGAFFGCSGLTSITLPFVGDSPSGSYLYPFGEIFGTTSFVGSDATVQYSVRASTPNQYDGERTYYIPSNLTKVTVTGGNVHGYAFYNCSKLTEVTLHDGVKRIGDYAFYNCSGLTNLPIANGLTTIGRFVFYGCNGLQSVKIPDGVTTIGYGAFTNCKNLTDVTIPDGVEVINGDMFYGCSLLTHIFLPASVNKIDYRAFGDCNKLTHVYYKGTASDWASVKVDSGGNAKLTNNLYYYSETEPATSGKYWHYDTDGVTPVVWTA